MAKKNGVIRSMELQFGMTLVELLISLGLVSISLVGVSTLYFSTLKSKGTVDPFASINQKRSEIIALVRNKSAMKLTVMDPVNTGFECLRDKINNPGMILSCPPDTSGRILHLRDPSGNLALDLTGNRGFTDKGVDCDEFGTSTHCNFRFNLFWNLRCVGDKCLAPDYIVRGTLEIANRDLLKLPIREEYFKLNVYQSIDEKEEAICEATGLGQYVAGKCNLRLTEIKCSTPGEYFVGFNGDGSIKCEPRNPPVCSSGFIYGVNSNGEAMCDPRSCL
jgi:hypothetical protein